MRTVEIALKSRIFSLVGADNKYQLRQSENETIHFWTNFEWDIERNAIISS